MDKNCCCCCACIHFDRKEKNGKVCSGYCKSSAIICNVCRDGTIQCEQFEHKCLSCAFHIIGCPLSVEDCKCYYKIRNRKEIKNDYYNGRSCLNHIENFFAFHKFLSPYENFYIGNIIKYLWRYKKKNGVKDLEKAKHYLEFLIEEQRKEEK